MGTEVKYIIIITNIVFAILFFVVLHNRIYAAAEDLTFDQRFFARDIAYTINAMCSIKAGVEAHYILDENLDAKIGNGLVTVSYKLAKKNYPYIQDTKCDIEYIRNKNDFLIKKMEIKNE